LYLTLGQSGCLHPVITTQWIFVRQLPLGDPLVSLTPARLNGLTLAVNSTIFTFTEDLSSRTGDSNNNGNNDGD